MFVFIVFLPKGIWTFSIVFIQLGLFDFFAECLVRLRKVVGGGRVGSVYDFGLAYPLTKWILF